MWKRVSWEAGDEPFEMGPTRGKNERAKRADFFIVEGRGDDEDRVWDLAGVGGEWNTRVMDGVGGWQRRIEGTTSTTGIGASLP